MASKRWIWEQYDRHVMGDTVDSSQSQGDAAIVRIHGTNKALAITSDCNPHYVAADPYEGGKQAIAEAERELGGNGRLVIRPSGTEPVIRVMAEGDDAAQVELLVDRICDAVRAAS